MIFALSAPLLMFGTAIAVDFTNATVVRSKLNAAADAAALAALTPMMMQQSDDTAKAAAQQMFKARADTLGSLVTGQTVVTVTITHPANNAGIRIVNVDYNVQNNTIFGNILNAKTMGIHGTSTAQGAVPPNIDFYMLLDNSPSMALPATSAGITSMIGYTPTQDGSNGCAFACHMAATTNTSSPPYQSTDTMGNLCADKTAPPFPMCTTSNGIGKGSIATNPKTGKQLLAQYCSPDAYCTSTTVAKQYSKYTNQAQMDNFALSRHYGISLRLDELTSGITTMLQTAWSSQNSGLYAAPPKYRFAAYSMDSLWSIGNPANTLVMAQTPNGQDYRSSWTTASANFGVMQMWANNSTCNNSSCSGAGSSGDVATNYDNAMSSINSTMPTPGYGTNLTGDKPQEVLFLVTDGVEDEQNINRLIQPINGNSGTNYCTQIKARGIRIAILYTEYLPVPTNSFYQGNVAPFQANIGPSLQACASPNLYYDAAIGTNLGAALAQLFQTAIQPASLSD